MGSEMCIRDRYAFQSCKETPIKAASLGNDAGIYGAVRLIVGA